MKAALFVYDGNGLEERVDPQASGNRIRELTPWIEPPRAAVAESARWVHELALEEGVELVAPAPAEWSLRVRGLEFARWRHGRLLFGIPPRRRAHGIEPVRRLARQLAGLRCPDGWDPYHPWRLACPEAWLESVLRARLDLIDPLLAPSPVYSQVAALEGRDRTIADLLARRRDGRLVLVEVKASADPCLPLQALGIGPGSPITSRAGSSRAAATSPACPSRPCRPGWCSLLPPSPSIPPPRHCSVSSIRPSRSSAWALA